jgi:hypothetical protein
VVTQGPQPQIIVMAFHYKILFFDFICEIYFEVDFLKDVTNCNDHTAAEAIEHADEER